MKTLCVLQHVEAEYLGLMEDHFEGRNIRFHYLRPFTPGAIMPPSAEDFAGLVILGAGPKGVVSGDLIPSLGPELRLTRDFLDRGLPVIGIGAGACILTSAAGGGADDAPLALHGRDARGASCPTPSAAICRRRFPSPSICGTGRCCRPTPRSWRPARSGEPLVFQIRDNCLGFLGHPGIKSAMIEDLIMEFDEVPEGTAETARANCARAQGEIAAALGEIMVGLIEMTGLMQAAG